VVAWFEGKKAEHAIDRLINRAFCISCCSHGLSARIHLAAIALSPSTVGSCPAGPWSSNFIIDCMPRELRACSSIHQQPGKRGELIVIGSNT
jgi:hypothetical protein